MKKLILLSFLLTVISSVFSQNVPTESETHIFWQPDRKLKASDFQGDCRKNPKFVALCDSNGICTIAFLGIFSILDIPKSKKDMGKLLEKAYFTPAFEKGTSCMFDVNDSLGIQKQQLLFDIYELAAREGRKQLKGILDQMGQPYAYGTIHIFYNRVKEDVENNRKKLSQLLHQEVYFSKIEGAYDKWRKSVDEKLEELKEYATTPEDCYRFVINKPTNKKYKQAEFIYQL